MDFEGYISKQYTVWCGVCGNWDQISVNLKKRAIKKWKHAGWKKTKNGWVCPKCRSTR